MLVLTIVAWLPELHPPKCNIFSEPETCKGPRPSQMGVLVLSLTLMSIGTAGIRPCNIPFGADQFDPTNEKGRKGINSYYNWYYTTFTLVMILASTIVVYMQEHVSWTLGFGVPAILMFCATILFFLGTRIYIYVKPEGSIFSEIAQVFVAVYKKRKVKVPDIQVLEGEFNGVFIDAIFYNPPPNERITRKLPLTNQFR